MQGADQSDADQRHEFQQSPVDLRVWAERGDDVLGEHEAVGRRVSDDDEQAGEDAGDEILWPRVRFLQLDAW